MRLDTSDDFAQAVQAGHQHCARLEFKLGDMVVDDTWYMNNYFYLDGKDGGSLNYDREADSRLTANGSVTMRDPDGMDVLDPLSGVEIIPHLGVMIDGNPEWVSMGVLGISELTAIRDKQLLKAQWVGVDRSDAVRWKPWSAPYHQAKDLDYAVAIRNIMEDRPVKFSRVYNLESTAGVYVTAEVNYDEDEDPWGVMRDLSTGAGHELYFGDDGELCSLTIRDKDQQVPTAQFILGQPGSPILTPIKKQLSNREVYSGVIVTGEAPWLLFPIRGEAWDDNPLNKSSRPNIGEKAKKIGDAHVTTNAQCAAVAAKQLEKIGGVTEMISFSMMRDPRRRVGDVMYWQDDELQIRGTMALHTLKVDIASGVMAGTVKRRIL